MQSGRLTDRQKVGPMACQTFSWQWAICSAAHSLSQKPKTSSKVSSRRNWHTSMRKANTPVDMSSLSTHYTHHTQSHTHVKPTCTPWQRGSDLKGRLSAAAPIQQYCTCLPSAAPYKAACVCELVKCSSWQPFAAPTRHTPHMDIKCCRSYSDCLTITSPRQAISCYQPEVELGLE